MEDTEEKEPSVVAGRRQPREEDDSNGRMDSDIEHVYSNQHYSCRWMGWKEKVIVEKQ